MTPLHTSLPPPFAFDVVRVVETCGAYRARRLVRRLVGTWTCRGRGQPDTLFSSPVKMKSPVQSRSSSELVFRIGTDVLRACVLVVLRMPYAFAVAVLVRQADSSG
jgi:hypothetical protein